MKIYYKKIQEEGLPLDTSFSFSENNDNFESVVFSGRIDKAGDVYMLTGDMSVKFSCPCDRCLDTIYMDFAEKIRQALSPVGFYPKAEDEDGEGLTDEEADMYVTPEDSFDLNEFLREEALLLIPLKRLCKEDCKGICEGCGAMLNKEKCRCGLH